MNSVEHRQFQTDWAGLSVVFLAQNFTYKDEIYPCLHLSPYIMGRDRASYTAAEKLKVVQYAEIHGNRAAGREFNVNEANVRSWRLKKNRLQALPKKKRAERGRERKFPELEDELLAWVQDICQQGIGISLGELRIKAKIIVKNRKIEGFWTSKGWIYGFFRRHNLSMRCRTHIAQRLPEDYEDKVTEFQRFIIMQRKRDIYEANQIGNADQTPLTFDIPHTMTIDTKGSSTVNIKVTGNEKNRFTVMLACTSDGGKLPPFIIFKQKTMPREEFPPGVIVRNHEKGWMDETLRLDWIKSVWGKRPGADKKSLLVLDAFRCHKTDKTKRALKQIEGHNASHNSRGNDQHFTAPQCQHLQTNEVESPKIME